MYPSNFDYYRPATLAEALDLTGRYGQDARPLAGGQSLIPLLKLRLANPAVIVDLNGISGLSYVREEGDRLAVGALTCHADVEDSEIIHERYPAIEDAARLAKEAMHTRPAHMRCYPPLYAWPDAALLFRDLQSANRA